MMDEKKKSFFQSLWWSSCSYIYRYEYVRCVTRACRMHTHRTLYFTHGIGTEAIPTLCVAVQAVHFLVYTNKCPTPTPLCTSSHSSAIWLYCCTFANAKCVTLMKKKYVTCFIDREQRLKKC